LDCANTRHDDGAFNEFRTGLDHLALTVSSRDELEAWRALLPEKGIPFSPIAESPIGTLVLLGDPDNTQLELWLPLEMCSKCGCEGVLGTGRSGVLPLGGHGASGR
jgi:hypothetical protein